MSSIVQAVILVGGLGTRLGPLTAEVPKPLLRVGGRPFIEFLLDEISRYGVFTEIVLLAGHRANVVEQQYGGRNWGGAKIRVVTEPAALGTGGALVHARSLLHRQFLLMNGDSFFDINLLDFTTAPLPREIDVRMALLRHQPDHRYGRVSLSGNHVVGFSDAGHDAAAPINAGIYVIDRGVLDTLPNTRCSLEQDIFPTLAASRRVEARIYDRYFIDIGVPADFERAGKELVRQVRRGAVFFDRDGVLNHDIGYLHRPEQLVWIDGAQQAVKACNDRGMFVFVVSNQAGVARGFYEETQVQALHDWMSHELAAIGAHIDAFEYCPHHPEAAVERYRRNCDRRKPNAGMILGLMERWSIDRANSFLIGDKTTDIAAAASAGIQGYLFEGKNLYAFIAPLLKDSKAEDE